MPINYKQYPPNWKTEIRPAILERAGNKCEFCGVANHAWILRSEIDGARYMVYDPESTGYLLNGELVRMSEIPEEFERDKFTEIVLTIAHLDHNRQHNNFGNLRALCQRCHLKHDAKDNAARRATNRSRRNGQLSFLDEGGT